jgi:hypothetical protein
VTIELIEEIGTYTIGAVLALLSLLQISPINIKPWSWIARCIGRSINKEVLDKVEELSKDVQKNKKDDDEQWVSLSRSHILRFGDELLHGVNHSQEHFDEILSDISKYEHYCESHPEYPNGKAIATIQQIKKTYQKCLDEKSFL